MITEPDETPGGTRDGSEPIGFADVLLPAIAERARLAQNLRLMFPARSDRARIRLDGGKAGAFIRPQKWLVVADDGR
jgi:hypothetical protein